MAEAFVLGAIPAFGILRRCAGPVALRSHRKPRLVGAALRPKHQEPPEQTAPKRRIRFVQKSMDDRAELAKGGEWPRPVEDSAPSTRSVGKGPGGGGHRMHELI